MTDMMRWLIVMRAPDGSEDRFDLAASEEREREVIERRAREARPGYEIVSASVVGEWTETYQAGQVA